MMDRLSPYEALTAIVQVRHGNHPAWETMAAFNVDSVAINYAKGCARSNPKNGYRVKTRPEKASDFEKWETTYSWN